MKLRLLLLTLFLSVGCLTAHGQDLRTGVATAPEIISPGWTRMVLSCANVRWSAP